MNGATMAIIVLTICHPARKKNMETGCHRARKKRNMNTGVGKTTGTKIEIDLKISFVSPLARVCGIGLQAVYSWLTKSTGAQARVLSARGICAAYTRQMGFVQGTNIRRSWPRRPSYFVAPK